MLLARLELRTCEIVSLELEDVDWKRGQFTVEARADDGPKYRCRPKSATPLLLIYSRIAPRCSSRDRDAPLATCRILAALLRQRYRVRLWILLVQVPDHISVV